MLLEKVARNHSAYGKKTIGIVGTHPGVGVTYTGIMISFFAGDELGRSAAYLECNSNRDMERLENIYQWEKQEVNSFYFQGVTIYKNVSMEKRFDLFMEEHDWIVMDFGSEFENNKIEFLRCDIKVVVGNYVDWNYGKLSRFMQSCNSFSGNETWIHLIPYANKVTVNKIKKETERIIYSVPFVENPLYLTDEVIKLFYEILV